MNRYEHLFFLALGVGLLFSIPAAESVERNLGMAATVLVAGYWGGLASYFLLVILRRLFAGYGFNTMLYNIWLFLSLMGVAVGALALIDEGPEQAGWALCLIIYGTTVGFLNRRHL